MHVPYHTLIPITKADNCLAAEMSAWEQGEEEEEMAVNALVRSPTCLRAKTSLALTTRMQVKGKRKKKMTTMYRVNTMPNNVSDRISFSHRPRSVLRLKMRSRIKGKTKAKPTARMMAALFRVKPTPHILLARKGLSMARHRSTLMSTMVYVKPQ